MHEGMFVDGRANGPGCSTYDDGTSWVSEFHNEKPVGEGVVFSPDRSLAFKLYNDVKLEEIQLHQAKVIVEKLGLSVPPPAPAQDRTPRRRRRPRRPPHAPSPN